MAQKYNCIITLWGTIDPSALAQLIRGEDL
jgi:hypothetical protein